MQPTIPEVSQRPRRSDRYRQMTEEASLVPEAALAQLSEQQPEPAQPVLPEPQRRSAAPVPPAAMERPAPERSRQASRYSAPVQPLPDRSRQASDDAAQPMVYQRASTPYGSQRPARMLQSEPPTVEAVRREAHADETVPKWAVAAICVLAVLCIGLFTAEKLMDAFIVTRQQERQSAYQGVVNAHPMQYRDLIDRYALENNLHPAFVCAIILNESSFNTSAESRVGARGLMQLMPDTASWIAHKLNEDSSYQVDQLWQADTNIRYGCWYLGYLSRLFGGDAIAVASAYHAGQGEISSWLANSAYAPGGHLSLDTMPEGPTKTYAGRVTRDYAIYDALYDQVFNKPPVSDAADDDAHTAG